MEYSALVWVALTVCVLITIVLLMHRKSSKRFQKELESEYNRHFQTRVELDSAYNKIASLHRQLGRASADNAAAMREISLHKNRAKLLADAWDDSNHVHLVNDLINYMTSYPAPNVNVLKSLNVMFMDRLGVDLFKMREENRRAYIESVTK